MSTEMGQEPPDPAALRGQGWLPQDREADQTPARGIRPTETGRIVGVARAVNQRSEQSVVNRRSQVLIWTFRLERHDEEGRVLPPVAVELRGLNFKGVVSEGDWVEVSGSWRPGSVLRRKSVRNLSTGDRLRVIGRGRHAFGVLLAILLFLAWCAFAALLITGKINP
jgi:hypothetical protein